MDRDSFLTAVGSAVAEAWLPSADPADPGLLVPDLPDVDVVDLFRASASAAGAVVHDGDPVGVIAGIARDLDCDEYLSWDPDMLPVHGLLEALTPLGLTRASAEVPTDAVGRLDHQIHYMSTVLGITGAEAGFAETGSIVLRSGGGRARMVSLIPLAHVVLLEGVRVHRSLAHWAAVHAGSISDAANVVFITGPSRTGDIEMRLNVGVHGPRYVHIVLI